MMSDLAKKIYGIAETHNGRYYLPVRYRIPEMWDKLSDVDIEYKACDELIASGHARWVHTKMSPAIQLTGKPLAAIP
jgi:hypothetical protein